MNSIQKELYQMLLKEYKKAALTRVEAAKVIGVSVATLDRMRSEGIGPEYIKNDARKQSAVRYPLQGLVKYLTENNIKTA